MAFGTVLYDLELGSAECGRNNIEPVQLLAGVSVISKKAF